MNTHPDPVFDILVNNIGITKDEWFAKSGFSNKKDFARYIKDLKKEKKIKQNYNYKELCSPRLLKLLEYSIDFNIKVRVIELMFIPDNFLKKELFYDDTDKNINSFNRKLLTSGFKISLKNKSFIEAFNDIKLDFSKFSYKLFADYPDARLAQDKKEKKLYNIIYISNKVNASTYLKNILKGTDCFIHHFPAVIEALDFLKTTHKSNGHIHSIIVEENSEINGKELVDAWCELKIEYSQINFFYNLIPIIINDEESLNARKKYMNKKNKSFVEFPNIVDDYILENVILNNCKNYYGGYFHYTLR